MMKKIFIAILVVAVNFTVYGKTKEITFDIPKNYSILNVSQNDAGSSFFITVEDKATKEKKILIYPYNSNEPSYIIHLNQK